ncbi:MAG: hypothetical protein ACKPE1_11570 [Dolichospermum sp.]
MSRKQAYQQALQNAGIPAELAAKAAEIVDQDDADKPNFGRSKKEQDLINQSIKFIK